MGYDNICKWKGDDLPVENVSWDDCQKFINNLNKLTGKRFSLPTEAQWEYAARGGAKSKRYKYSGGYDINKVAWHKENSNRTTHKAGSLQPNELGIYDMSGNVWEWCNDWYDKKYYGDSPIESPAGPSKGSDRVFRGGSFGINLDGCRVALRGNLRPSGVIINALGFRVVLP